MTIKKWILWGAVSHSHIPPLHLILLNLSFIQLWGRTEETGGFLFPIVRMSWMFYSGVGGKATPLRKIFLLNWEFLRTNRHKVACYLSSILVIITYQARVCWFWCCLKLAVCSFGCLCLISVALGEIAPTKATQSKHIRTYLLILSLGTRLRPLMHLSF